MDKVDVLLVKAREHKTHYIENMEDIRIGYLDAVFRKERINTHIIDFSFSLCNPNDDSNILAEYVSKYCPRIIIFFIDKHPTNSPAYTIELFESLIQRNLLDDIHISFYGNTHVNIDSFFSNRIGSVILGEEYSALALVNCILRGESIEAVDGIAYIDKTGVLRLNPASLQIDLDKLPSPTRYALNQIKMSSYCASILSSRGCFGKCTYCYLRSKEKYFGKYPLRFRSIESIIHEIEALYIQGVTDYYFCDDEFLQPYAAGIERVRAFSKKIKEKDLHIKFSIYSRADCINEEIVHILSEVGLYCVFLGVESFSQSVLNRYNKGLSVEDSLNAIAVLKKYNIHIRLGMIMFDPLTTVEELSCTVSTLQQILKTKPTLIFQSLFFSNVLIPLNNTPSIELLQISQNSTRSPNPLVQNNYVRRSRTTTESYRFTSNVVSDIYSCVEYMAQKLLILCIKDENSVYFEGYSVEVESRLLYITRFAVELLSHIINSICKKNSVEQCKTELDAMINSYFNV